MFLHQLSELKDEEILSWGTKSKLRFYYYAFQDAVIQVVMGEPPKHSQQELRKAWFSAGSLTDRLFNSLRYELGFYPVSTDGLKTVEHFKS